MGSIQSSCRLRSVWEEGPYPASSIAEVIQASQRHGETWAGRMKAYFLDMRKSHARLGCSAPEVAICPLENHSQW